jgi:hypothetical protein
MTEYRDNRGALLEPGVTVAYNLSGEVAVGRLLDVRLTGKTGFRGAPLAVFRVELAHAAAGQAAGHVSKVKDHHNLLVIRES